MKYLALLVLLFSLSTYAADSVPEQLQSVSVTIRCGNAEGSGSLFSRKDAEGKPVTLVWTAGHVIESAKSDTEFEDVIVTQPLVEDGRTVGKIEAYAEVLRYSNAETGEDLAVLRIRKHDFSTNSVVFFKGIPTLGTPLLHVGSLHGSFAPNSVTSGEFSFAGRLIGKTIYDQVTCTALPGSSGGGIFLTDGRYVGMLVRTAGETVNLIVPVRRIRSWAKSAQVEWAIDATVQMPSEAELQNTVLEPKSVRNVLQAPKAK